ncbi:MAG: tetratricopeptide repeat protein [Rhizobiaceae bacterium]|nr:tetratricopeptide repeat protein [Rhizobiaceae bacterium]
MLPVRQNLYSARRLALISATAVLALGLAGCANKRLTTGSIDKTSSRPVESLSQSELNAELQALGSAYTKNTKNPNVAMRYAAVLQLAGRTDQSLAVMRKAAIDFPEERSVLAAYGKALASAGQLEPALDAVRRAQTPEYPDWKLLSAEAAILDQLGQRNEARALYRKALDLRPHDPSILSNLGMSYVLEGDLKTAEKHMRAAVEAPGADSRVRQNLALVVGLQGRFKEAEQIAGAELTPEQAKANVAYLRTMLSQQNAWSQLEDEERNTN